MGPSGKFLRCVFNSGTPLGAYPDKNRKVTAGSSTVLLLAICGNLNALGYENG
jgi:hypothetical protein